MKPQQLIGLSFLFTLLLVGVGFLAVRFLSDDRDQAPLPEITAEAEPEEEETFQDDSPNLVRRQQESIPVSEEIIEPEEEAPVTSANSNGVIRGRVLDPMGSALAEAEVELARGPALVVSMPSLRTATGMVVKTDGNGGFRLEGLTPAEDYILVARHTQFGERVVGPVALSDGEVLDMADIKLQGGQRIYGFVGAGGRPIEGARIVLEDSASAGVFRRQKNNQPPSQIYETTSDGQGNYEFVGISVRNFQVTAHAEGFGTITQANRHFLSTPEDQPIDFEMSPEMSLLGIVVDQNRTPVADATVTGSLSGQHYRCENEAITEPDGTFVLSSLVSGQYHLTVSCDGYSTATKPRVEAGSANVELVVLPQGSISGQVFDERTGKPVTSFEIYVMRSLNGRPPARTGQSQRFEDGAGLFEIGGMDPNSYIVEARAKGYAPSRSTECTVARGEVASGIRVPMSRGGIVAGRLTDSDGKAMGGIRVSLNENKFKWNPVHDLLNRMSKDTGDIKRRGRTDEDGRFEIPLVVPGTYQISAKSPDHAGLEMNDIEVIKDQTTDLGTLVMVRGGVVEGFTYDELGAALVGATVTAVSTDGDYHSSLSDGTGRFEIAGLRSGEYSVQINQYTAEEPENILLQMLKAKNSMQQITIIEGETQTVSLQLSSEKN